ncbi:cobyric acid synthase [Dietzia sp.]|uniref:cobyric acid synthase n=1 Tax=Dietzia sp. TaxID=1871616 RepID=UPI002FDA3BE3
MLVAGTTSDAGKSLIVAGLCRAYARRGIRVAPFKAQNMSNNSAVAVDGGEIGRAQALQAEACGLRPRTDFNPVLLKPGSDRRSQVIVRGRADGHIGAADYVGRREALRGVVGDSLGRLRAKFDLVVCEGAGSAAEVNLRAGDIANMGLAELAELPTIVVGDIDRGGVLAHFLGTIAALDEADRRRIAGFVVNKFRGDQGLLRPGLDWVAETTGRPVFGVVPFLPDLWIDTEDGLGVVAGGLVGSPRPPLGERGISVAAIRFPRVSNSTDVDALSLEPGVRVRWVTEPAELAEAELVLLPGSKSTVADLGWMRERGLDDAVREAEARGASVLGICGGFQMLAESIDDDVEAPPPGGRVPGLGLLPVDIEFGAAKIVREVSGLGSVAGRPAAVSGYEIHHGRVARRYGDPFLEIGGPGGPHEAGEGARAGRVYGTHLHGLFAEDEARRAFLAELAQSVPGFAPSEDTVVAAERARMLDVLADAVESALDLDALLELAGRVPDFGPGPRLAGIEPSV